MSGVQKRGRSILLNEMIDRYFLKWKYERCFVIVQQEKQNKTKKNMRRKINYQQGRRMRKIQMLKQLDEFWWERRVLESMFIKTKLKVLTS